MLVTSKEMLERARRDHYAVPSVDFVDADTLKWYLETAESLRKPIILALCQGHLNRLIDLEEGAALAKYYGEKASVPVVLHLDHGEDIETVQRAVELGFTSVMLDASMDPFEENVEKTKHVVALARAKGVYVEAEIGHVGGVGESSAPEDTDSIYTSVREAVQFVRKTGVDSLAVSIGTAHGLYKGTPKINFERLHELRDSVSVPLVLHGGSSSGDENLRRCAAEGIAKINIYSDLLAAAAGNVLALPEKDREVEDYYRTKAAAKKGIQDCIRHCYELFATRPVTKM